MKKNCTRIHEILMRYTKYIDERKIFGIYKTFIKLFEIFLLTIVKLFEILF